jgi:toxin-antitoxin system PIN domain toxin
VRFLLDVNVLVGLALPDHELHSRAHSWFRRQSEREWATCALTQAGFLRVASRLLGGSRAAVREALAGLERDCRSPEHDYWSVDTDLRELSDSMRSRLIGPNQITDMQLLMLAHRYKGQLATFDAGIRELAAGTRYASSLLLL